MKAMVAQKRQTVDDNPVVPSPPDMSPTIHKSALVDDSEDDDVNVDTSKLFEDNTVESAPESPRSYPLPPPSTPPSTALPPPLPMDPEIGEEVVHFQSYNDAHLLKYIDRVVKTMLHQY